MRFVNGCVYTFIHRCLRPRILTRPQSNLQTHRPPGGMTSSALQTGARVALFGMIVNSIFALAKILGGLLRYRLRAHRRWHRVWARRCRFVCDLERAESRGAAARCYASLWSWKSRADRGHIVAVGVVAAAVGLAIQSVREIFLPHHGPAPYTLVILVVVIVVKETLFRYVNRIGRKIESTAVQTDAWHHRSDALTSAAAFIGISVALIGGKVGKVQMIGQPFCLRSYRHEWHQAFAAGVLRNHGHRAAENRQVSLLGCQLGPWCHGS